MDKYINAPISDEDAKSLHSGDYVYITGTIYTARDAAHKRMAEALSAGQPLPIYITWDHLQQEKEDQ
mgnify:CR=1 FL=1